jgi:hypothetical protein
MNKDELLKELQKLKDEDYSNDALFNDGYRTSMMDAIDLVKKLNIDDVSKNEAICNCANEYWKEDEGGDWYCTIHDKQA